MIIIKRLNGIDKNVPYNILIDGKEMMSIKDGEEVKLKLRSNSYTIQIEGIVFLKTLKSKKIKFDVQKEDITFICYPKYHNNIISKFIHKEILKDGIKLKRK